MNSNDQKSGSRAVAKSLTRPQREEEEEEAAEKKMPIARRKPKEIC
jgi:hypothetical protein